jgi:nucleoside-diphosphate-sugar epimerase
MSYENNINSSGVGLKSARKILVFGAGGKIGASLMKTLNSAGYSSCGIVRNELVRGRLRLEGLEAKDLNQIADAEFSSYLDDFDVIINLTSASGIGSRPYKEEVSLLEKIVASAVPLIHFSSVAVFGTYIPAGRAQPKPDGHYGASKLAVEKFLQDRCSKIRTKVCIVRLGHVYGENQWVSEAIKQLESKDFFIPFDGSRPSNAINVDNVGHGVSHIIKNELFSLRPVLLVEGRSQTWRDVFDWHRDTMGFRSFRGLDEKLSYFLDNILREEFCHPMIYRVVRSLSSNLIDACTQSLFSNAALKEYLQIIALRLGSSAFEDFLEKKRERITLDGLDESRDFSYLDYPWLFSSQPNTNIISIGDYRVPV